MRLALIACVLLLAGCKVPVGVEGEEELVGATPAQQLSHDLRVQTAERAKARTVEKTPVILDDGSTGMIEANKPISLEPKTDLTIEKGTTLEADTTMLEGTHQLVFGLALDAVIVLLLLLAVGFVAVKFWKWARAQLKHAPAPRRPRPKAATTRKRRTTPAPAKT